MAPTLELDEPPKANSLDVKTTNKSVAAATTIQLHKHSEANKSHIQHVQSEAESLDIKAAELDSGESLLDFDTQHDPYHVLHHSNVTTEFDPLRFEAAASKQLAPAQHPADFSPWLISSPYNSTPHLLDLRRLDLQNALFAKALTVLQPTRPDYATADYGASLNFDHVLETLRALAQDAAHAWSQQAFYLVIFRSTLKEVIDNDVLYAVDAMSHQEATASGGLLKYWFGKPDARRRNLATCLWRNREDARLGGRGPWHVKARRAGRELYEKIDFETHHFVVTDGAESWRIEEYKPAP